MKSCLVKSHSHLCGPSAVPGLRCRRNLPVQRLRLSRAYDVEVEPERRPGSAPEPPRWGAPPPPPPPPMPSMQRNPRPSRREALFGFLGAGIGVGGTALYYNTTYDLSDDSYYKALDSLLADPDFLSTVEDEVLYNNYQNSLNELGYNLDQMQELDKQLKELDEELKKLPDDEDGAQ